MVRMTVRAGGGAFIPALVEIGIAQDSSGSGRQEDTISGDTRVSVDGWNAILTPTRDASCRRSPALAQHGRDLAPAVEAPQPDLATGHEAEEEDQRRVLGR
jgi:hypothetical protein